MDDRVYPRRADVTPVRNFSRDCREDWTVAGYGYIAYYVSSISIPVCMQVCFNPSMVKCNRNQGTLVP